MPTPRGPSSGRFRMGNLFLTTFVVGICSFYGGLMMGSVMASKKADAPDCFEAGDPRLEAIIERRVHLQVNERIKEATQQVMKENDIQISADPGIARFPLEHIGQFATGMARVDRDAFAEAYDTGVPMDKSQRGNDEVLILYTKQSSLPSNVFVTKQATSLAEIPKITSIEDAMDNCHILNIVLADFHRQNQCIAIMGQYESFHIQKYMRIPSDGGPLDPKVPLRYVNRGMQTSGRKSTKPPPVELSMQYWKELTKYLTALPSVLETLRPIAEKVAKDNTIVVMVCNHGQSELLMNFVCNARSKNLDFSSVLVFATDDETRGLAEGLGLHTFSDERIFGAMPKHAARQYADHTFMAMMAAKVYCVQLVSMLGYDILFQDVDVVWYKDPLAYFHDHSNPHYGKDIYFQDDGNHALFYAPYSANTGFYYVRSNVRTQYFFNSLLMAGDLILSTHSHQIALIALLNEHASMYGLQVKIFERNTEEFPGGFAYHRNSDLMKRIVTGKADPYIFHMSWTSNKSNKARFFRQMGEWHLNEQCVQKTAEEISDGGHGALLEPCCSVEPLISCHYRDKASKNPCRDSPPIDKNGRSFW